MNRISIYLNACAALAACVIGMGWYAARAQQAAPVQDSPTRSSLDVVGIKLGMTVREAMLALKADNPRLTLMPATRQFEGFAEALMPSVTGLESATPGPNSSIARAGENI